MSRITISLSEAIFGTANWRKLGFTIIDIHSDCTDKTTHVQKLLCTKIDDNIAETVKIDTALSY